MDCPYKGSHFGKDVKVVQLGIWFTFEDSAKMNKLSL